MDKYERLEELKRKVMVRLNYQEEMPDGIKQIIIGAFDGILKNYKNMQCNSTSIENYVNGNMEYAKNEIEKYLNNTRKSIQMQYFQNFFRELEIELEDESMEKEEEKHKEEINSMDLEDEKATMKIMDTLEYLLKDIVSSQNRILDARGYDVQKISDIQQITANFIRKYTDRKSNDVYQLLKKDNKELKDWILLEYEAYLNQEKLATQKEDDEKSEREEFVGSLNANIDLQEQHDFAKKVVNESKENEGKEDNEKVDRLPDNVID